MAPPTGPRGGSNAGRNRQPTRSSTRGSIQKRRGGRFDRDGDVSMDALAANGDGARGRAAHPPRRGAGPTRASTRIAQNLALYGQDNLSRMEGRGGRGGRDGRVSLNASKARFAHPVTLKIRGLKESKASSNSDGGLRSLLTFLERKASKGDKQVTIQKSALVGDHVFIQVGKDDAQDVLRLNDYMHAGAKLAITESQEPWPRKTDQSHLTQGAADAKEKLKGVLFARYNVATRILDLSLLGQDQVLVSMGLFEQRSTAEKAFKALVVIADSQFDSAQAKADAIQGVSLAGNQLDDITPVFDLAEYFPRLKMLDLSNNRFEHTRRLYSWSDRFRSLENLVLSGNPIIMRQPDYQAEILKWFPRLQILDGAQVRSAEEVEARLRASRPNPIPQAGSDFRDVDGVGEGFLRTFFPLYDADRASLLSNFYDEDSRFTLSVVTHAPKEGSVAPLPWQPYLKFSRNMVKIQTAAARSQRLFEGAQTLAELWRALPATKHPDLSEHTKYIIDCHPLPGLVDPSGLSRSGVSGLILTAHGEFDEADPASGQVGKRSFSRTFVLGPGRPGRTAIRVISDMLSLRAWNPVPQPEGPTPPAPAPAPAAVTTPEEQRKQMVIEVSKRTNMTLQYAEMCLSGVDWDFDKALVAFGEKRGELPPEAFLPSQAA